MGDININKFRTSVVREGSRPASAGFVESEGQDPVDPAGSTQNHLPVTIAPAADGLSITDSQVLGGAGTTSQYLRGDGSLDTFPALTGFVPYTGATQNVDLGEFGVDAGFVNLDTTPTNTPTTQGTIFWDEDDETVDVVLNGYIMKIGEDQFYPVKNQTGSSIAKGTAVRFAGTVGASGRLLIAPFIANGTVSSSFFMGVTAEAIADGSDGKVLYFGRIRGINTNSFNEGDVLYASTTVAGGFQTAVPVAPNNIVQVAAVINKSINQGVIFIRPSFGSNINQDEGVKIVSPTTGQLLQLQAGGLWENKTKAQILGGTSSQFVKGDGSLDSNVYALNSALANYLPLAGGTLTGALGGTSAVFSSSVTASGGILTNSVKSSDTNVNLVIGTDSAMGTSLVFTTDFSNRVEIFATGNVGIATGGTDAGFKLDVNGTGRFSSTLDTSGRITITSDAGNEQLIIRRASNTNEQLIFGFHSSDYAKIQAVEQGVAYRPLALNQDGGNVLIGTTTDNGSRLTVNGSLALPHTTKSANYTLDATDYTVGFDCASNRTATLPDATTCQGRIYVIYQYNTGTAGERYVTLDGNGSQTINGLTTFSLQYHYDFSSVMIQSNGSNWIIISDALYPAPV